ncbi:MAG TPA: hypothetical protein VLS25_06270 [Dehalococcoidia bacterium]|nr:hypothetical protein [Dehalococcoidia bacterium]
MPDDILPIPNPQPSVHHQCLPAVAGPSVDQTESAISENQRQSAAKPRRGGARPGAGAPRGNLNALKHGRRSRQFATIGVILSGGDPLIRDTLLAMARRYDLKNARAQDVAAELFIGLYNHARDVAHGKTSPGPFAGIAGLNVVRKALSDAQSTKTTNSTQKK